MSASVISEIAGLTVYHLSLCGADGEPRIDDAIVAQLNNTLEKMPNDVQAIILTGNQQDFCMGMNTNTLIDGIHSGHILPKNVLTGFITFLNKLDHAPQLIVSHVRGAVYGAGMGIAAASDLVIAEPSARFGLPETMLGLIPAVIFPYVARRIGVMPAKQMALGLKSLSAPEALRLSLVDHVDSQVHTYLEKSLKRVARMDSYAIRKMKTLVAEHFSSSGDYFKDADIAFNELLSREETHARLGLFLQGDTPWQI